MELNEFEKILEDTTDSFKDEDGNECWYKWQVLDVMKEVWNKAIEAAAENAETKEVEVDNTFMCYHNIFLNRNNDNLKEYETVVDKQSILKLKV